MSQFSASSLLEGHEGSDLAFIEFIKSLDTLF
jgi:hypothetical protein